MRKKVLCVDDEPNVLDGYRRALRKDFDIRTAEGGEQGIKAITEDGPFAVIVSDMRMPGMDGVHFLSLAKAISPESVRVMLTGNSDQQTATDALNKGSIFRFLTKPCPPETLAKAINAALEQHRLVTAEKELLEQTLNNSLQVMIDILAMVNPTAFSRSTRVKRLSRDIAARVGVRNLWEVEIAAMLSQIGCVTVPEGTLIRRTKGLPLGEGERRMYEQYPEVGRDLIARIPRLEIVAEIIALQNKKLDDSASAGVSDSSLKGARILQLALDYDKLLEAGKTPRAAFRELCDRVGWYDPVILDALGASAAELREENFTSTKINVSRLMPGMILAESIATTAGAMVAAQGQEVSLSLALRVVNLAATGTIADEVTVRTPAK